MDIKFVNEIVGSVGVEGVEVRATSNGGFMVSYTQEKFSSFKRDDDGRVEGMWRIRAALREKGIEAKLSTSMPIGGNNGFRPVCNLFVSPVTQQIDTTELDAKLNALTELVARMEALTKGSTSGTAQDEEAPF